MGQIMTTEDFYYEVWIASATAVSTGLDDEFPEWFPRHILRPVHPFVTAAKQNVYRMYQPVDCRRASRKDVEQSSSG